MDNKNKKFYASEDDLRFRSLPDTKDDTNIIKKLKKGDEVTVLEGPWYEVQCGDAKGWVHGDFLKENLLEEVMSVIDKQNQNNLPQFVVGEPNSAGSLNAKKVREIIKDEFGGGRDNDYLQCVEYVQYKIQQKGISIKWPIRSGRNGGNWGNIFKQYNLYKVSDIPTVNCAMSFTDGVSNDPEKNRVGHVAFVEKINNDGSIEISEVNWPKNGIYNVRTLPKAKWQNQYKGIFIEFS